MYTDFIISGIAHSITATILQFEQKIMLVMINVSPSLAANFPLLNPKIIFLSNTQDYLCLTNDPFTSNYDLHIFRYLSVSGFRLHNKNPRPSWYIPHISSTSPAEFILAWLRWGMIDGLPPCVYVSMATYRKQVLGKLLADKK